MAKSPNRKSKSPVRAQIKAHSKSPLKRKEKEKFFDLIQKKVFFTSDYNVMYRTMQSKNGKRRVTYHVTDNPTVKKDGATFKNWKIVSNDAA